MKAGFRVAVSRCGPGERKLHARESTEEPKAKRNQLI
jgi:hypothetical protein